MVATLHKDVRVVDEFLGFISFYFKMASVQKLCDIIVFAFSWKGTFHDKDDTIAFAVDSANTNRYISELYSVKYM